MNYALTVGLFFIWVTLHCQNWQEISVSAPPAQDRGSSLNNAHNGFVRKCSFQQRKCCGVSYFESQEGPTVWIFLIPHSTKASSSRLRERNHERHENKILNETHRLNRKLKLGLGKEFDFNKITLGVKIVNEFILLQGPSSKLEGSVKSIFPLLWSLPSVRKYRCKDW